MRSQHGSMSPTPAAHSRNPPMTAAQEYLTRLSETPPFRVRVTGWSVRIGFEWRGHSLSWIPSMSPEFSCVRDLQAPSMKIGSTQTACICIEGRKLESLTGDDGAPCKRQSLARWAGADVRFC